MLDEPGIPDEVVQILQIAPSIAEEIILKPFKLLCISKTKMFLQETGHSQFGDHCIPSTSLQLGLHMELVRTCPRARQVRRKVSKI